MKNYIDCWISAATTLFSQALAGEPRLTEFVPEASDVVGLAFVAQISGDLTGSFTVNLDPAIVDVPLLGEGVDQSAAWPELLREVADAAAGELYSISGQSCHVRDLHAAKSGSLITRAFRLASSAGSWTVTLNDELRSTREEKGRASSPSTGESKQTQPPAGVELLLDVELEAALRFGCCEMPLGEILELGPGDVIELDRHIADPVDLVVGDKIVARGDVVLVNGNFGLRVTEVSAPQKRLESIRCLF